MAVFIVLRPYFLTPKLKSVIRHNLGHSKLHLCRSIIDISPTSALHNYAKLDFSLDP